MGHIGTHLDIMDAKEIPLDYMYSNGKIVDVSHVSDRDIDLGDLGQVQPQQGDFFLFRTGFMNKFSYGTRGYEKNHPQLSHQLIEHLIAAKIHFIGLDAPGVRRGAEHPVADQKCADGGVYIIESMANLEQNEIEKKFRIVCLWLHRDGMTGIPCRVIAELEPDRV